MAQIEIESPTSEQRAKADMEEMIELAGTGVDPVRIVSRLMAKGIPREEAERILPQILEATRGKRLRKMLVKKILGGALAVGGFGTGIYMLINGVLHALPFLIGGAGLALLSGYLDNLSGFFSD